jgi:hypothetical protein
MKTSLKSTTMAAATALLFAAGLTAAAAQAGGAMDHGKMEHGGMEHGGMDHGGMDHGGMGGMGGAGGMKGGKGGMEHGGMKGGGMGGMDHSGGGMMKKMLCGMTEHTDGRLAYLKAELKLNDQQMPAWNAFNDAFRAAVQKSQAACAKLDKPKDPAAPGGVLGQLTMMDEHMTLHLDQVRASKAAIEPLFTALSDEQKKTADQVMTGLMGLGMGGMMGGGGMGGGMMGGMDHGGGGKMGGGMGGGMQH